MARAKPARGGGDHCPICTAPAEAAFRPFCSRRCADVDLSRWLRGAYAIPAANQDLDEDSSEARAEGDAAASGRSGRDDD